MIDLSGLNPCQRASVEKISGPLLLLAGAGTGKTRVITYRIAHMIHRGVAANSIVAVTFTNKAAREMKDRIKALVSPAAAKQLRISTFHALCLDILRRYGHQMGLTPRFGIAGTSDQVDLMRKAMAEKGLEGVYRIDVMLAAVSYAKNHLWDREQILAELDTALFAFYDREVIAACFELYQRQLRLHRYLDFDDCIYNAVCLLRKFPDVKKKLNIQFMLVDEFQDTNPAQLCLIKELCQDHSNICVVGDDDQSIYSWRGAVSGIFEQFEAIFPQCELIKLEQNYRCTNVILNAANHVIRNNVERKSKNLWSASQCTTPIIWEKKETDLDEARFVAEKILGFRGRGYQYQEMAILIRATARFRNIEAALRECQIPYAVFGGQSFFEKREVRDVLAYLRLIAHPEDRLAFWRIINVPRRGFGLKSLEDIDRYSQELKISPYEVLKSHLTKIPKRIQGEARSFVDCIEALRQFNLNTAEDLEQLIKRILKDFALEHEIRRRCESNDVAQIKIQNTREMAFWVSAIARQLIEEQNHFSLDDILDRVYLGDERKAEKEAGNVVSLMTIHAAKGLEFPIVFMPCLEEGVFPHRNSLEYHERLCEERRLFYVAMTRAKEHLILSFAKKRMEAAKMKRNEVSRFFKELPESCLMGSAQRDTEEKKSEEQRKKRTLARLSAIRAQINS